MRLGIVGDRPETLKVAMDTTILIAGEANARGHEVFYTWPENLCLSRVGLHCDWLKFDYRLKDSRHPKECIQSSTLDLDRDVDLILMRQDPPVDEKYIATTHILDYATVPVLNNPSDVRSFGEKTSILHLPSVTPESIVSLELQHILEFVAQFSHGCILKPLNDFNGRGVLRLERDNQDLAKLVGIGSHNFSKFVMIQEFRPEIEQGDKRVFMVDGKAIGRMNRVPAHGEWRANIHLGAQPEQFNLSERDREIVRSVSLLLKGKDLPLVCIDIIGDYLTEINVTSPSGIPEVNAIYGDGHEKYIVDYLERRVST
jgi:glutathione synthase